MTKARKTKHSGTPSTETLPEPLRSMAEDVQKDVADASDAPPDGADASSQAAEQMEEYVASRSPAAHPPARKP